MAIITEGFPHKTSDTSSYFFTPEEINKIDSLIRGGYFNNIKSFYDFIVKEFHVTKLPAMYGSSGEFALSEHAMIRRSFIENLMNIPRNSGPLLETIFKKILMEFRFFLIALDIREILFEEDMEDKEDLAILTIFYLLLKELDYSFDLFRSTYQQPKEK